MDSLTGVASSDVRSRGTPVNCNELGELPGLTRSGQFYSDFPAKIPIAPSSRVEVPKA